MLPDFLGPLDPDLCAVQAVARGERVALAGTPTDRLLILAEGAVRTSGSRQRHGAGDMIAPRAFFGSETYPDDIIALRPGRIVHVPRTAVRAAMDTMDPLTWSLARVLAQEPCA